MKDLGPRRRPGSRARAAALAFAQGLALAACVSDVPLEEPRARPPPGALATAPGLAASASAAEQPPSAPAAQACEPLVSRGFDRPETNQVPLGDAPIQWGDRLSRFYESLAALERKRRRGHVRIGFHGDSNLTKDGLTGELRRALQARFGDAGHGFVAPVRAWGWYVHEDVQQGNDAWWRVLAISAPRAPDLGYGVSGIAAEARAKDAVTWFATAGEKSTFGRAASKIGVFWREQPSGGRFRVDIDGAPKAEIATGAAQKGLGHQLFDVPDGPHRVDIRTTSDDVVRLLGVYLERGDPSVVVDSFGVGGVYFQALTLDDHALTRSMERARPHDLVVYWLGANAHHNKEYSRDVAIVVGERRKDDPGLPILIIGPPDAMRRIDEAASDPISGPITARLEAAADASKCAFWNMREAQGGDGIAAKFLKGGLATDRQHLSVAGSRLMAHMLLYELWRDYQRWLAAHPRAGCDPT